MSITQSQTQQIEQLVNILRIVAGMPIEMANVAEEVQPPPPPSKSSSDFRPKYKNCSTRYDKDTDTYNNRPLDPTYFKQYYHTNNVLIECDGCGKQALKLSIARHKKTQKCKALTELNKQA